MIKYFKTMNKLKNSILFTKTDDVFLLEKCPKCDLAIKKDDIIHKVGGLLKGGQVLSRQPKVIEESKCGICNELVGYFVYYLKR